jgi:hypothetical protein
MPVSFPMCIAQPACTGQAASLRGNGERGLIGLSSFFGQSAPPERAVTQANPAKPAAMPVDFAAHAGCAGNRRVCIESPVGDIRLQAVKEGNDENCSRADTQALPIL